MVTLFLHGKDLCMWLLQQKFSEVKGNDKTHYKMLDVKLNTIS